MSRGEVLSLLPSLSPGEVRAHSLWACQEEIGKEADLLGLDYGNLVLICCSPQGSVFSITCNKNAGIQTISVYLELSTKELKQFLFSKKKKKKSSISLPDCLMS